MLLLVCGCWYPKWDMTYYMNKFTINDRYARRDKRYVIPIPQKDFHVVLMTIYSVENAGIRHILCLVRWLSNRCHFTRRVHNSLSMPTDEEIDIALNIIQKPDLTAWVSSLYPIASEVTTHIKAFPNIPIIWGEYIPHQIPKDASMKLIICVRAKKLFWICATRCSTKKMTHRSKIFGPAKEM